MGLEDAHVEETVATTTLVMIGHAAFHAAVEQYPGARLTLRQGARVILKRPERSSIVSIQPRPMSSHAGRGRGAAIREGAATVPPRDQFVDL
jgi:hypothetical protein